MPKKIDTGRVPKIVGTLYPPPFAEPCRARERQKLGDLASLTQFGVNLLTLPPGAWSSRRHWHTACDEFIYVLEGEATLVTDEGDETLLPGDAAGFKAGEENGHCVQNRSSAPVRLLEIGTRDPSDGAHYPELDLLRPAHARGAGYTQRDGTPYPESPRRGPI